LGDGGSGGGRDLKKGQSGRAQHEKIRPVDKCQIEESLQQKNKKEERKKKGGLGPTVEKKRKSGAINEKFLFL